EYDHIHPEEKCMALLLAEERFLKIKQAMEEEQNQPENFPMPDDDEYTIIYRNSKAITPDLPTEEPDNSLSIGDEHLNTIPETEKPSVKDLVPIPNISITSPKIDFLPEEFSGELDLIDPILPRIDEDDFDEDEGEIDIDIFQIKDEILHEKLLNNNLPITCDSPSSDDFSLIFEEKSVTFSNPLFDSNNDFTFSDDESLSDEDVSEDIKIYSNPLFEFDDEYISSDVNPLFDEVLEVIECKVSYDSNLDDSTFLVTSLSDSNEDGFFTPSDDVELLLYHDPSISVVSILEGFTNEPPLEENDDLFYLESKENDWKKILYDAPFNNFDELNEDKCFDPGGGEIVFSLNIEDDDSFTFVIRTFLPYLTYPVDSPLLLSTGSEDTIFDPGIST
ncbi:hypothetical protein Tco_1025273, partial [Tanacetum coccineum]